MKILKPARQKDITYRGTKNKDSSRFSSETMEVRREWSKVFKEEKDV